MEALLGNGFKPNTLKGYNTSVAHLASYLEKCHGAAHIRHHGDIGQQRAYRNSFQNAGAYQHQDHPALCQIAGYSDRPRHGGLAEAAGRNVTENYSYFYPRTTKQNNEAKR